MGLAQPKTATLYTVEEYLELERSSEVRHEYIDGEVYEMAGESLEHGDICTNLTRIVSTQLLGTPCRTLSKDTKVRSGALSSPRRVMKGTYSYPDLLVVCGEPQFHDEHRDVLINPTLIIEVLSPATEMFDRGEKFRRYRAHLPSLTDYLLVAQSMPLIEHFHLQENGIWGLRSVEVEGVVPLTSINCTLPLADVYDRVIFPPEPGDISDIDDEPL